jgi:hypothetical protein
VGLFCGKRRWKEEMSRAKLISISYGAQSRINGKGAALTGRKIWDGAQLTTVRRSFHVSFFVDLGHREYSEPRYLLGS